jgi:undecaprenyl-diphosphatase
VIEWWQGLLLALLQGATEFLPISSSAHLLLPSLLLDWPDQGLAFDVAVHVGTLLAVLWYFRSTLFGFAGGVLQAMRSGQWNESCREVLLLAVASVPVAIVGLLLNDHMHSLRSLPVIITTTIVFALLLAVADRRASSGEPGRVGMSVGGAMFIGLAQAFSPIPGTSRSGITITAGLLLGLSREAASRFAFLLSIPVIGGAGLVKSVELADQGSTVSLAVLGLGVVTAAIAAYLCITLFLRVITRVGMMPFVYYRLLLGALLLMVWLR